MDAKSSNKSQKNYEGDVKNEGIMTLCDLPDEILQKIMTYISIKEVVATSTLSKEWRYKWIINFESNMELDEGLFSKRQYFIDFVDKVYEACNDSNPKKFSLFFEVDKEFRRLNKWLSAFVNPMIEELNLQLDRIKKPLVLPNHIFTSKKLTKFQLNMKQVMKVPSTINFQNLVTLTLKNVTIFPNNHLPQFFICLPSLKELILIECDWKKVGSLTIICEVLEKMFIREWKYEEDDNQDDNEEEEEEDEDGEEEEEEEEVEEQNEDINYNHGEIGFHAPKLQIFSYDGDLINDYSLFSTTSVSDASIEVHENNKSTLHAGTFVSKLFKSLIGVERLSITDFALEALFQKPDLAINLPEFYNLVVLRVVSSSPMDLSCQGLQTILQRSSILEEIEFDVQLTHGLFLDENGENEINPLPRCFETHLKIIKIHGFCGDEDQLNAIKFLLKTTQVLDALYIHGSEYYFESHEGREELERLYLQILKFPKASLGCIINLE